MKKRLALALCLTLPFLAVTLSAKVIKVPEEDSVVSVDAPDSWSPENTDKGVVTESADKEATVFFEVTSAKGTDALLDENIAWLKDQKVSIDQASKSEKDFKTSSMSWSRISWDGTSEEWGPATIGFAFADVGNRKVLVVTYWITKKGWEKHDSELSKIFDSVKKIKG
jgi:hypothetical protein